MENETMNHEAILSRGKPGACQPYSGNRVARNSWNSWPLMNTDERGLKTKYFYLLDLRSSAFIGGHEFLFGSPARMRAFETILEWYPHDRRMNPVLPFRFIPGSPRTRGLIS
jgi:hypothetical protein